MPILPSYSGRFTANGGVKIGQSSPCLAVAHNRPELTLPRRRTTTNAGTPAEQLGLLGSPHPKTCVGLPGRKSTGLVELESHSWANGGCPVNPPFGGNRRLFRSYSSGRASMPSGIRFQAPTLGNSQRLAPPLWVGTHVPLGGARTRQPLGRRDFCLGMLSGDGLQRAFCCRPGVLGADKIKCRTICVN